LRVTVRQEFRGDGGLASFKCTIVGDGILAEAAVSVYQPDDVDAFLEHRTQ
jgi:predicted hotdog family 3-hydroxylacyl-ACP dehydratase